MFYLPYDSEVFAFSLSDPSLSLKLRVNHKRPSGATGYDRGVFE